MNGKINLKKLDMIFGKSNRGKTSKICLWYSKSLVAIFFVTFSCNNLEKSPDTTQIERLVLTKNDLNNGYLSVDTVFIRRNKKEDSSLNPLVGIKAFWKNKYIYSPYYFNDDAGVIWILPHNFFIDMSDKDLLNTDLTHAFLSKDFKLILIMGMNNQDHSLFIDKNTQIKVNHESMPFS